MWGGRRREKVRCGAAIGLEKRPTKKHQKFCKNVLTDWGSRDIIYFVIWRETNEPHKMMALMWIWRYSLVG